MIGDQFGLISWGWVGFFTGGMIALVKCLPVARCNLKFVFACTGSTGSSTESLGESFFEWTNNQMNACSVVVGL